MPELDLTIEEDPVLRTVGRYAIVREVGRGGTAIVYLARQTDLGRDVALKELAAFHAAKPAVVERFLRESRLTGALNHPNVVTVHEYLEHEGTAYIAMEYFERGSLRPWVGHLTPPQVAGVLDGLLAGLAHAESRGIVHRDLKPENVMVTADGGVKITDFGIAKALQASAGRSLTAQGTTVGTPEYMAPEQGLGEGIGPWTDLYAVGVIAYELLAGRVPFPDDEMPLATLLRHVNDPVPPLRSVAPGVDPLLADWVERMLAKSGEDRPGSAAQARDLLEEAVLGVLGPRWRRDARLGELGELGANGHGSTAQTRLRPRRDASRTTNTAVRTVAARRSHRVRRPAAWLVGAVAVAGVAAAIAVPALSDDREGSAGRRALPTRAIPDFLPRPSERLSLAVAGPYLLLADPRGRVVQLDRSTLDVERVLRDPAGPTSSAVRRGSVYVADGDGLTARRAGTLAPVRSAAVAGGASLSTAADGRLVVAAPGGRVCVVSGSVRLGPCGNVDFRPGGVASNRAGGLLAVVDPSGSRIVFLRPAGARLVPAGAVDLPTVPGEPRFFRGRLYVAVERGIAVVDVARRTVARIVRLPVSPAAVWVSGSGRLVATLPGTNQVVLLDAASSSQPPSLFRVRSRPIAVTGAGETAFVAALRNRIVVALDTATGRISRTRTVEPLSARTPRRSVLRSVTLREERDRAIATFALAGSGLDATGLVVRDADLADGIAMLSLWQGAIETARRTWRLEGLTVRVGRVPGRLSVRLSARAGSFAALRVRRGTGSSLELVLTKPRQAPTPPPAQPLTPQNPPSSSAGTPRPPAPPSRPATTTTTSCCVTG